MAYRLLTLVQIAGVLTLAAGVPDAFADGDFTLVTVGYVVMRVPLVVQWLRVARDDPARRAVALRYAAGIALVQVGWLLRLALPEGWGLAGFLVLALVLLVALLPLPVAVVAAGVVLAALVLADVVAEHRVAAGADG